MSTMGPFLWSEVPRHPVVVPPAICSTSSGVNSRAPKRFNTRSGMNCSFFSEMTLMLICYWSRLKLLVRLKSGRSPQGWRQRCGGYYHCRLLSPVPSLLIHEHRAAEHLCTLLKETDY